MTETNTNEWTTDGAQGNLRRRYLIAMLTKGFVTGIIGGVGAFTYNKSELMTASIDPQLVLGLTALAGVYAHLLANDLHESIRVGIIGFFVGGTSLIVVWVAPLWILPYTAGARDILLPQLTGTAVTAATMVYAGTFLGAYLTTLTVDAYVST
ncbi:hypothetical protein [Haladaptatus caseinilyticus]|uniref:hypothetical protein n=1 Tax=Haladaptatus caseinilyticus TaxID=2993314 RepID=UPI00224B93AB|nr:hypothetical protein [Haladaptatus caseinilyticus]